MYRIYVVITGMVQGVFFRQFIKDRAIKLNLTGFVKNANNHVEAVFEGSKENINEMLRLCKTGSKLAKVNNVKVIKEDVKKEFGDFRVRYD